MSLEHFSDLFMYEVVVSGFELGDVWALVVPKTLSSMCWCELSKLKRVFFKSVLTILHFVLILDCAQENFY